MQRDRRSLIESRNRIREAVTLLQAELVQLEKEIKGFERQEDTTLDVNFFFEAVLPVLSENENGMTSGELRKELNSRSFHFNPAGFRTFLTRLKSRGLVDMKQRSVGPSIWLLSEKARAQSK
jgi:hypothetical protein